MPEEPVLTRTKPSLDDRHMVMFLLEELAMKMRIASIRATGEMIPRSQIPPLVDIPLPPTKPCFSEHQHEGVPAQLTSAYTAGAGETGLSTRGGSRITKSTKDSGKRETGLSTRGGSRITKSTKDSGKSKIGLLIMHQLIWGLVVTSVN
nr:hypothetical protein [Tanacetum cinerariifolium]